MTARPVAEPVVVAARPEEHGAAVVDELGVLHGAGVVAVRGGDGEAERVAQ